MDRSGPRGCSVAPEGVARGSSSRFCAVLPTDTVARLRQHLADDLDTPKALDALDGWARRAIEGGGIRHAGTRRVRRCRRPPYWVFRFAEPLLCAFIKPPAVNKGAQQFLGVVPTHLRLVFGNPGAVAASPMPSPDPFRRARQAAHRSTRPAARALTACSAVECARSVVRTRRGRPAYVIHRS